MVASVLGTGAQSPDEEKILNRCLAQFKKLKPT